MFAATGLDLLLSGLRRRRAAAITACALALVLVAAAIYLIHFAIPNESLWLTKFVGGVLEEDTKKFSAILLLWKRSLPWDVAWYVAWFLLFATLSFSQLVSLRHLAKFAACLLLLAEATVFQRFVLSQRTLLLTPENVPALAHALTQLRDGVSPAPVTVALVPPELADFAMHLEGIRNITGGDSNMRAPWAMWFNQAQGLAPRTYQLDSSLKTITPQLAEATALQAVVLARNANSAETDMRYEIRELAARYPYAELWSGGQPRPQPLGAVKVLGWKDGYVQLDIETSHSASLRVREFPDAHWRAKVNGRLVACVARGPFLQLELPAGKSTIELRYVDLVSRTSVIISIIAWMALLVTWVLQRRRSAERFVREHRERRAKRKPPSTAGGHYLTTSAKL
jgi:hypothetical protein